MKARFPLAFTIVISIQTDSKVVIQLPECRLCVADSFDFVVVHPTPDYRVEF